MPDSVFFSLSLLYLLSMPSLFEMKLSECTVLIETLIVAVILLSEKPASRKFTTRCLFAS